MEPTQRQFFYGLESLRGLAALMVVFFHVYWVNPLTPCQIFRNSFLMVDLFYVLSGFVLCHNYQSKIKNRNDLIPFILLRFGRLFPLHLVFLLLFLGLEVVKYGMQHQAGFVAHQGMAFSKNDWLSFVANLLLVHPFFVYTYESFNCPSWSIGVEFYTYIIFALLLILFGNRRRFLVASVVLVVLAFLALFGHGTAGLTDNPQVGFLRCLVGFFIGVLTYQIYRRYSEVIFRWSPGMEWVLGIALLAFLASSHDARFNYAVLLLFPLLVLVIAVAPAGGAGIVSRILQTAALRWLGKISYSIYLSHLFFLVVMERVFERAYREFSGGVNDPELASWMGLVFVFLTVAVILVSSHYTHQWIELAGQTRFRRLAARWQTPSTA